MSIFGPEFEKVWPKANTAMKLTDFGKNLFKKCQNIEKPDGSKIDLQQFITKSSNFPIEFGTNTCRVISQPKNRHAIIQKQVASAYPVIHERVLGLYLAFLEHKCKYGNKHELKVFPQLSLTDFVQRLLAKRCVTFMGKNDKYLLITRERGASGFMDIGTDAEKSPLLLQNVLSYDEIKKLPEQDNMLLIVSYAWDGNALPGNEFWMKMLKSTGDSSTACSTLITELHNPHINSLMVNGCNLHIASEKYGVIHIAEYAKKVLA